MPAVHLTTVFADGPGGGNPAPIVLDAEGMADAEMQTLARSFGHECAFVVDAAGTGCDLALRFWVPNHEMSMCGHATVGTVWLLAQLGVLGVPGEVSVHTSSGVVRARVADDGAVSISQPAGRLEAVDDAAAVLDALGLTSELLAGQPIRNATTSRTKTLVPIRDTTVLDAIAPRFNRVEAACVQVNSTGLYPYAPSSVGQFDARQFPRASGYPEDPATGVAATALAFGLLADRLVRASDGPVVVRQGRAMRRPSRMTVSFDIADDAQVTGCWLGGPVELLS